MKKTTVSLFFILLLGLLMILCACGAADHADKTADGTKADTSAATAAKEPTEAPEEKSPFPPVHTTIVAPDEKFVGIWLSLNTDDKLTVNADGTALFNDLPAHVSEATDHNISIYFNEWIETADKDYWADFVDESGQAYRIYLGALYYEYWDHKGFLDGGSNDDDLFPYTTYYLEGTENPAEQFYGTWTLCSGEGDTRWNDSPVETFVITADNKLQINGDELPVSYDRITVGHDEGWFVKCLEEERERIHLYNSSDNPDALSLYIDRQGWSDVYCKDVKSAELTLDNWRDYFDVVITYSTRSDDWGDVKYVMNRVFLAPKENMDVCGIRNGRVAFTVSPTAFAMIEYDVKASTYTIRDMTAQERGTYNDQFFKDWVSYTSENDFKRYSTLNSSDTEPFTGWGVNIYAYAEDHFTLNGNTALAPTATAVDVDVTRIMGTIYYRDK